MSVKLELDGLVQEPGESIRVLGMKRVVCPNAPSHLQVLYLEPWALRSAKVGDRVKLEYRTTMSSGNWVVTEVLS